MIFMKPMLLLSRFRRTIREKCSNSSPFMRCSTFYEWIPTKDTLPCFSINIYLLFLQGNSVAVGFLVLLGFLIGDIQAFLRDSYFFPSLIHNSFFTSEGPMSW